MRSPASLVVNLERAAQRFGDRCAIQQGADTLSYSGIWQNASNVAGYLREQGLRDGDRVALLLDNSADFVSSFYGTLLAGGIAVLLNAAAREREIRAWLEHSGAGWLITEEHRADAVAMAAQSARNVRVIVRGNRNAAAPKIESAESLATIIDAQIPFAPTFPSDDTRAACIIYTSGTTGSPKGVVLTHRNLASNTAAIVEYLQLGPLDSVLSILPFYYSYGSSVLHSHIQAGARIVLESNLVYPHLVVATLAQERVTGFAGVPSTYALLLNRVELQKFDLSALRYVTQAGGAMSPALTQRLRAAMPATQLFVMYGQTEATARLSYLPPAMLDSKPGSVGIPVQGVEIEIRDPSGAALPRAQTGEAQTGEAQTGEAQTGEVWVRGPNVMQGYWEDPAATARVLRDGWLSTGDMGYLDTDGYLYLHGRRADMIKTGAHRVHPRDVEEVIEELAEVAEVAVVGVDDEVLGQAVAAYVVRTPESQLDAASLKMHCRGRLAAYKIPKSIEFVPALPKTASGKTRRIELAQRK